MIITSKNLYKNKLCRFCKVTRDQKHHHCYHGIADLLGSSKMEIIFEDLKKWIVQTVMKLQIHVHAIHAGLIFAKMIGVMNIMNNMSHEFIEYKKHIEDLEKWIVHNGNH